MKRISLAQVPAQVVFDDQRDSFLLAGWNKIISLDVQGLPWVGDVSVASATNVFSLQKGDRPLAWRDCRDNGSETSVSRQFLSLRHQGV